MTYSHSYVRAFTRFSIFTRELSDFCAPRKRQRVVMRYSVGARACLKILASSARKLARNARQSWRFNSASDDEQSATLGRKIPTREKLVYAREREVRRKTS